MAVDVPHGRDRLARDLRHRIQSRLNSLTKPLGSLGRLEQLALRYALLRGELLPELRRKAIYIFCSDHGVTAEGVSAYPSEVTQQMVKNFISGGAAISVLCLHYSIDPVVVDMGVLGPPEPTVRNHKIAAGTENFAVGPAMTRAQAQQSIDTGVALAREAAQLMIDYLTRGIVQFAVNMAAVDKAELEELRLYIDLARRLGLPKSSIANICGALADAGLVRRVSTSFALGRRLAELGGAYLASVDQVQEFYEVSRSLPAGSEETVQFAILDGLEVTYLARHDGRQPVRLTSAIGRRLPAFTTATGKAALAALPDDELERRLARVTTLPRPTRKAHGTLDELRIDLAEIRGRGYAIDDEQTMEGVVCYGVMVPSRQPASEGPCAASITLLKVRATAERVPALIADLHWLAAELSDPIRRD
jgi:DNA-binding IclR family transcriptional regulator